MCELTSQQVLNLSGVNSGILVFLRHQVSFSVGQPRQSEDDQQREQLGPRGVPKSRPGEMVPQRRKKTEDVGPGETV